MANRDAADSSFDDRSAARPGGDLPGRDAENPTQIPPRGWLQVVRRAWKESKNDHVSLLSAGVAFYAFLAVFPTLIAVVSVYGMVNKGGDVQKQVNDFAGGIPGSAKNFLIAQLKTIVHTHSAALTIGLIISVLGALWSASGAAANLIQAVNIAYDEDETRKFFKLRGLALALTLGGIVFFLLAIGLVGVLPVVLNHVGLGVIGKVAAQVARWVLLVALLMGGLAVVYRVAPDRDAPKMRWASLGAVIATVLWAIASVGFSFYVSNFGSYNKTYGALAGLIVFMMWLYISVYVVLLGAEINAEAERQTVRDTTKGAPQPMGQRGGYAADTVASPAETPGATTGERRRDGSEGSTRNSAPPYPQEADGMRTGRRR